MTSQPRKGVALLTVMVVLAVSMIVLGLVAQSLTTSHRQSRLRHDDRQCRRLAEAAATRGTLLAESSDKYDGETWEISAQQLHRKQGASVTVRLEGREEPAVIATAAMPADAPKLRHSVRSKIDL